MYKFTTLSLVLLFGVLVSAGPMGKISIPLQRSLQNKPLADIFVSFQRSTSEVLDQVQSQSTFALLTRGERATAVYQALTAHATDTQQNVLEMLHSPKYFSLQIQSLWITNQVFVRGADSSLIHSLAALDEVSEITENGAIYLDEPTEVGSPMEGRGSSLANEWGIEKIRAPEAWKLGVTGVGAVVGIIDTGARHTHEALRNSFRGGSHSWFNPYSKTQFPHDGHGHGTHVTGTAVGGFGVGVAPGAQWISCKGMTDSGSGTWVELKLCGQFMACPHDHNGQNSDCSKVPDVVSNSWGVGRGSTEFDDVLRAWHVAGIVPVKSLGNGGPSCKSGTSPGDSQVGILGIGATTGSDNIAYFSSRGPSFWDEQKPQVAAPGDNVRSSVSTSDTAYSSMSGTSMAAPHVAGLVALLRSRKPDLTYAQIQTALESSAARELLFTGEVCFGVPDNQWPNYKYGFGRIDAFAAVSRL